MEPRSCEWAGCCKVVICLVAKNSLATVLCEQVYCRAARSKSCWQNFGSFPSKLFTQPFQYFQIVNLADCLFSWYEFIMKNPSNISSRNLLFIHVCLQSDFFPSGFSTTILYAPFIYPIRATCLSSLVILDLTVLKEDV